MYSFVSPNLEDVIMMRLEKKSDQVDFLFEQMKSLARQIKKIGSSDYLRCRYRIKCMFNTIDLEGYPEPLSDDEIK